MLLNEEPEQGHLITDAPLSTGDSSEFSFTAEEAVRTLHDLQQSMKECGRMQEVAAIDFALDTMKFRYVWISDLVEV